MFWSLHYFQLPREMMKETGMVERRREETEMKETGVETQLVLRLFISIFLSLQSPHINEG